MHSASVTIGTQEGASDVFENGLDLDSRELQRELMVLNTIEILLLINRNLQILTYLISLRSTMRSAEARA